VGRRRPAGRVVAAGGGRGGRDAERAERWGERERGAPRRRDENGLGSSRSESRGSRDWHAEEREGRKRHWSEGERSGRSESSRAAHEGSAYDRPRDKLARGAGFGGSEPERAAHAR